MKRIEFYFMAVGMLVVTMSNAVVWKHPSPEVREAFFRYSVILMLWMILIRVIPDWK